MDVNLFVTTKLTATSSSFGSIFSSSLCFSFFSNLNNGNKYALAGPPLLAVRNLSRSSSSLLACNHHDYVTAMTLLPDFQAAFEDRGRRKGEKIYTARDIALGLIDVFGWSVGVDGKGEVGKVADIVHIGTAGAVDGSDTPYEYLLKVVRPLSNKEKTTEVNLSPSTTEDSTTTCYQFTTLEIKILIPIVDEFMQHIDAKKRHLQVKPPAGLLELAARPEAINRLQPEIQLFCKRYAGFLQERFSGKKKIKFKGNADHQEIVHSYMPTRDQLFAVGRSDLVRRIKEAGGFLYVANALGLKTTRRPNGFWDDLRRLDFEIECFLLESWVKHVHSKTAAEKPELTDKLAHTMSGDLFSVNHDGYNGLKVMPQQKLLAKAGRWDLHHAIVWNGGYREVAHLLGRTLIRRSKKLTKKKEDMLNLVVFHHVASKGGAPK